MGIITVQVPKADYAVVGGSGTLSSDFPLNSTSEDVTILDEHLFLRRRMDVVRIFGSLR